MNLFNPAPGASFDQNGSVVASPVETETTETAEVKVDIPAAAPETIEQKPEPIVTEPAAPIAPSSDINWEQVLTEKTGGKFKTWDDVSAKLAEEKQDLTFSNEESKKIFDYLREGKVDDVLQVYNEQKRLSSLKEMSDEEAVKLSMEYKQAGLKGSDIDDEFSVIYQIERPEAPNPDDYLDEDAQAKAEKTYQKELKAYEKEHKALLRKLKQDAVDARDYLGGLKKDILLPDIHPKQEQEVDEAEINQRVEEANRERERYLNSLNQTFNEFKEIPLKVNDGGVSFDGKFEIEESERVQLKKDLAEKNVIDLLLSRYVKEDGYDTKQLMEDVYLLQNKEKIINSIIKQAVSKGKLEKIKEAKNVDLDATSKGNFEPSKEAEYKEFSRNFLLAR